MVDAESLQEGISALPEASDLEEWVVVDVELLDALEFQKGDLLKREDLVFSDAEHLKIREPYVQDLLQEIELPNSHHEDGLQFPLVYLLQEGPKGEKVFLAESD